MLYKFHKDGTLPTNGEVFVFGSNLAGIHGAGAAKIAAAKFGAVYGQGEGWGKDYKSFAIPTKDYTIRYPLPLDDIEFSVNQFVRITNDVFVMTPGWFVTRIGCGLAGYKDEEIAPMFKGATNCSFAEEWKQYLE